MVYAELKLERKVDWSIFPKNNHLGIFLLEVGQRDIPDLYDPSSNTTKDMLTRLRKVPTANITASSLRGMDEKPKATNFLAAVLGKAKVERKNEVDSTMGQSIGTTLIPQDGG
jgi:hypothetical protein